MPFEKVKIIVIGFIVILSSVGCGGGGGSSSEVTAGSTESSAISNGGTEREENNGSSSSSSMSGSAESADTGSVGDNSSSVSEGNSSSTGGDENSTSASGENNESGVREIEPRIITVSDAYILEADVRIGDRPADLILDNGQYEWWSQVNGKLTASGGANDLAEPKNEATDADPKSYVMSAPAGYTHINPFTTLLVNGVDREALKQQYPNAAEWGQSEGGKLFNFDVVKAGETFLPIAKETARAALVLAEQQAAASSAAASSSSSSSAPSDDGETGSGSSQNQSGSEAGATGSTAGNSTGNTNPFPAAARATWAGEIDTCQDNECINAILLDRMMKLLGPYTPFCEKLPGTMKCLEVDQWSDSGSQAAKADSSTSSSFDSSSSQASSSSSDGSSQTFSSSSVSQQVDPFPD